MKKIKVVRPLKPTQKLREEASQSMLQQTVGVWKPPTRSGWTSPAPMPAPIAVPDQEAEPAPRAPVAYSAPAEQEAMVDDRDPTPKYLTGSNLAATKMPLPKGVYIVVGLTAVDLVLSMFRSTDTSVIFTIVMFFDLVVCIGLLLKIESIRKMLIVVSVIVIVLAGIEIFGLMLLKDKVAQQNTLYNQAVSRIDPAHVSVRQRGIFWPNKDTNWTC